MEKRALVVFAHPNPSSYCGALRDVTVQKLSSMGFNVIESDLYKMNFNPVFTLKDINIDQPKEGISISAEIKNTVEAHKVLPDAQAEIDKVLSVNYIAFIAPTWWGTVPAILKGWFDRVLLRGLAFDVPENVFQTGYLKGKKCLLVTTTGSPKEYFKKEGKMGGGQTIEENYWHIIQGVFGFCGMESLPIFSVHGMDMLKPEEREKILANYEKKLESIETQEVIRCPWLHYTLPDKEKTK